MAKEQLLRKRKRDLDRVCTTFRVDQPSYRFTLETCDNLTGIISDGKGNRVAVFDAENSAVVSRVATYNVCIEGEGTGVAYTEWTESGGAACCDELRQRITELETLLNNVISGSTETGCCEELRTEITNLDERVTILEQGGGATPECCERLSTEIESLKVRIAALESKAFIATYNVTTAQEINEYLSSTNEPFAPMLVKRGADYYTVTTAAKQAENKVIIRTFATLSGDFYMFTYTITDGTWASSSYGFQGKLTAGENITINNNVISATGGGGGGGLPTDFNIVGGTNAQVTKSGNVYTVSATDTNTQTTLLEGANVTITDSGTGGNHVYTIAASGGGGGGLPADFNIVAGNNVQVAKNGNVYTVSATDTIPDVNKAYVDNAIAGVPTTTLVEGANVTISDSGTGGNHVYTISASGGGGGGLPSDFDIVAGTNVSVAKSGNAYTVSATDTNTQTTLLPGTGVTITDGGTGGNHVYTITATGGGGSLPADFNIVGGTNTQVSKSGNVYTISATDTNTETVLTAGDNVSITDSGTGGNHNYRIDVGDAEPDDYMVYSKNPNIIITAMGNDQEENIFLYDASIAGATADNNQLSDFETGTDKIEIKGTSLPKGQLTQFATQGAGIYYSNGILSYNDGTNVKTIVKVVDGSTVAAADVTII